MRLIIILSVLFSVLVPISAEADSFVIPLSSPIYEEIDTLYITQALSTPSSNRPWSLGEAEKILERLDRNKMNREEKIILESIETEMKGLMRWNDGESFSFSLGLDTSLESYIHTDSDEFYLPQHWLRGFEERKPLLKLKLDAAIDDNFYTYCDLQYGMGKVTKNDQFVTLNYPNGMGYVTEDGYVGSYKVDDDNSHMLLWSDQYSKTFSTNVPAASALFDFIWPKRALVSFSGKNWNLQFGRDRIETGTSKAGSLLLDNHSDFNDHFTLSFYSNRFKYTWRNVFLNGITDKGESSVKESRIFMIHTLEFRPMDSLSILISEDLMYRLDGKQAIDFSFFNPAYIYHNLNNRSIFNAIAYLEAKWTPIKNLELNTQFVLDQATAPNEDDSQKASWGLSLGGSYRDTVESGWYSINFDAVYTTPLLYRRDSVDFIKCMRYFHLTTDTQTNGGLSTKYGSNALSFEYLGFKYGGDAVFFSLGLDYYSFRNFNISSSISLLEKGEMNIFHSHNKDGQNEGLANYQEPAPSGNPTFYLMVSNKAEGKLSKLITYPDISMGVEIDWIGKLSSSFSSDVQISLYSTISI